LITFFDIALGGHNRRLQTLLYFKHGVVVGPFDAGALRVLYAFNRGTVRKHYGDDH